MSIEKGDKTIATDGWLHDSTGDGYCDDYGCVKADDPLRVRVDTEQEARDLVDMAEKAGWDISTNFDHWELSQINCVSLEKGHVNTYCTNRDTTCRHGVPFSGRKSQIRKYLSYNSEEETMSDLTHEKIEISMFEGGYKCKHCGIVGFSVDWSEDCPDHPDRQREDDDDGKGDERRKVAKRFLEDENPPSITQDVEWSATLVLEAIRDHCELSDGVCEWTTENQYAYSCEDVQYHLKQVKAWSNCPDCGREIKITTDEGGKFEVGDVVRDTQYREGDPNTVREYFYIQKVRDYDTEFKYAGKSFELREDVVDDLEKVGSFKPDDNALERVPEWVRGELVVCDFDSQDSTNIAFALCTSGDMWPLMYENKGKPEMIHKMSLTRTGIVLSFSEIAEVSNVSTLHVDA